MDTLTMTPETAQDWHVCGIMVQAVPEKIPSISTALLAVPHTEIPVTETASGKMVAVLQSHDPQLLLDNLERIKDIDGVLHVSLVYHQQDEQSDETQTK